MANLALLAQANAAENLSIFSPASPSGVSIRDLAVVVLAVTGAIFLIVEAVLIYSVIRFRRKGPPAANEPPQVYGSQPIEIAWTAAPALIVLVLMLVVVRTEWEVRPPIPPPSEGDNALYVTVVGRQWWWEYRYDSYNGRKLKFITANELHIPASDDGVERPIYLTLKSADVCHSFWVPRLGGKTDLIPAKTNSMWLQTKETGLFLGQCAEFCGTQHAKMLLRVDVDSAADFEKWLANEEQPPVAPANDTARKGQDIFTKQACTGHRIVGVSSGTYAPDLTHLMSRKTLASGIMPNTKENLRDWILDPQEFKPRCLMAAFDFNAADIDALVEYLRALK